MNTTRAWLVVVSVVVVWMVEWSACQVGEVTGFGVVGSVQWTLGGGPPPQLSRGAAYDNATGVVMMTTNRGLVLRLPVEGPPVLLPQAIEIEDNIEVKSVGLDQFNRRGYLCARNRKVWSFPLDSMQDPVHRYTSPALNIEDCAFDFAEQNIYYR